MGSSIAGVNTSALFGTLVSAALVLLPTATVNGIGMFTGLVGGLVWKNSKFAALTVAGSIVLLKLMMIGALARRSLPEVWPVLAKATEKWVVSSAATVRVPPLISVSSVGFIVAV